MNDISRMSKVKNVERRRGGFAFVKSIISIGLAAQMLLSSMLVSPEPVQQDASEEITASEEVLLEQNEQSQEIIEEAEYAAPNEPGSVEENLSESDNPTGEDPHEGQKEEGNEPGILSAREQGFDLTTGSGIQVFAFFGEDAGLPEETSLEVIEDRLAAESVTPLLGDYSLYSDPNERAGVEQYLKGCLNLDGWDFLIQADVLDFSLWENGEMFIPAAPMTAELRLDMLPESMAPYVTVIGLDGDTAGLRLAKGTAENGAVVLRFEIPCPTRLAICVSAYEYLYWNKEGWDFSVYGPEGAQLGSEEAVIDAGGMKVQEAQNLVCYTEDGSWAGLWVAFRPSEDVLEEVPGAELYALSNGVRTELPSENGYTYRPIYLYDANGFALLTPPDAEESEFVGLTEEPGTEPGDLQEPDGINQNLLEENPALPVDVTENVPEENAPEENVPEENTLEENAPEENAPEENLPEENGAEPQTEQNLGDDVNTETVIEDPANESNPEPGAEETPSEGGVEENVSDAVETVSTSDVMKDGDSEPAAVEAADSSETDVVGGNEPETYTEKNLETGFDALGLSGSMPEGVDASVTDALAQLAELDLAKLENGQSGMEESLPDYRVLAAWELKLSRNGETWQPDEYSVLTASVSHEEISKERDLQLWRVEYDAEGQPQTVRLDDFTAEEGVLTFPVTESGVYAVTCTAGFRSEAVTVAGDALPAGISVDMTSVNFDASQLNDLPGQTVDEMAPISLNAPVLNLGRVTMVNSFNAAPPTLDAVPADEAAAASSEVSDTGKSAPRYEVITAYDISLYQNELGYQPDAEHPLTITIKDEGIRRAVQEGHELQLWHVHEGAAPVQIENFNVSDDTLSFVVDSLSVFVVTYTVDFHWGDYTYSIAGESEINLSALLEKLGVTEIALADVAGVSFTNPAYIEIEQLDADWLLRSLAPFDTDEALVLALKNGETVKIKVTDATGDIIQSPAAKTDLVYTGEPQELIIEGSVEDGAMEYRLGETGDYSDEIPKAKDAGEYAIYFKVKGNSNEFEPLTATIARKPVTVTADSMTKNFDDPDPTDFTATVEGLIGSDTINYTVSRADGTDPGDYVITPAGDAEQVNYSVTYVPGTLTIKLKVTFMDGDTQLDPPYYLKVNDPIGDLPGLTGVNCDFAGWYNGEDKITADSSFNGNTTLTARYTVTVSFTADGVANPDPVVLVKGTEQIGSKLPTVSRDGYRFDGWYDNPELTGEKIKETSAFDVHKTLYAKFVEQVKISFEIATTEAGETTTGPVNTTVDIDKGTALSAENYPALNYDTDLYAFKGWFVGDTRIDTQTDPAYTFNAAATVTARLVRQTTVTFKFNQDGAENHVDTGDVNRTVTFPADPRFPLDTTQSETAAFKGWYNGDTQMSNNFTAAADMTLTAHYTVTVNFIVKDAQYNTEISKTPVVIDKDTTLGNKLLKDPVLPGDYKFQDWYLMGSDGKPDETQPVTADSPEFSAHTDVVAKFAKQVTLIFDKDGTRHEHTVNVGEPFDLLENPVKDGYRFDGWFDGTGKRITNAEGITDENGNLIGLDGNPLPAGAAPVRQLMLEDNLTLYAHFVKLLDVHFLIVHPVNKRGNPGEEVPSVDTHKVVTVDNGTKVVPFPDDPLLSGYYFKGWYKISDTGNTYNSYSEDARKGKFVLDKIFYGEAYTLDESNSVPADTVFSCGENDDVTLSTTVVAKFTKKINVTFQYKKNGELTHESVECVVGESLKDYIPNAAQDGFRVEWYDEYGNKVPDDRTVAETDENKVFSARYIEQATVTFKNGDNVIKTVSIDKGTSVGETDWPADPTSSVDGQHFIGWLSGENKKYDKDSIITADVELTARFGYTVTFMAHKNDNNMNDVLVESREVEAGASLGWLPAAPFMQGYTFKEWRLTTGSSSTVITSEAAKTYTVNQDLTITAIYEAVDIYTVTVKYIIEGETTEDNPTDSKIVSVDGSTVTADDPLEIPSPASFTALNGDPVYPDKTNVIITKDALNALGSVRTMTVTVTYKKSDAKYKIQYMLKNLQGNNYTSLGYSEELSGVSGAVVTPEGNDEFTSNGKQIGTYAEYERSDSVRLAKNEVKTVKVYYTRKSFTLTYDTLGIVSVPQQTARYGESVTLATPTAPAGYTFEGWYRTKNADGTLTDKVSGSITLEADTTLYAQWNGAYSIVYLFEKFSDDGTKSSFEYDDTQSATGTVGAAVYASDAPKKTRAYYEEDTAQNANSSVVIKADGSSVLYVYYKLKEYTLYFRPGKYYYNSYDVTATLNGESRTGNNNYSYHITAKLGQDIADKWLSAENGTYYYYNSYIVSFTGWYNPVDGYNYVTKQTIVTTDLLPKDDSTTNTFTASWSSSVTAYTVNYWLQNANDDGYSKSEKYSQTVNSSGGGGFSAKDITGYTVLSHNGYNNSIVYDTPSGYSPSSGDTYNFYYDRDRYDIEYYYGSTLLKTIRNVKFDANINSSTYIWTPDVVRDCGKTSDYEFKGWYADDGLTTPYEFDIMPAHRLKLYAKLQAPVYTVTFYMNDGTSAYTTREVEAGKSATTPESDPTRRFYSFDGWYSQAEGGDRFSASSRVEADTSYYAHWKMDPLQYTVKYVKADQSDTVELPAEKTVSSKAFTLDQKITVTAPDVPGYIARPSSQSINLKLNPDENIITFTYEKRPTEISYNVHYVLYNDHTIEVADTVTKTVPGTAKQVTETAATPKEAYKNYVPTEASQSFVMGNPDYYFYYIINSAKLTVNYLDMAGDAIEGRNPLMTYHEVGSSFDLETALNGYTLDRIEKNSVVVTETHFDVESTDDITINLYYKTNLTILAKSKNQQYNGSALSLESATNSVSVNGLKSGHTLTGITITSIGINKDGTTSMNGQVDVGIGEAKPSKAQISGLSGLPAEDETDSSGNVRKGYYNITYISGTLTVTKINVVISLEPDRWTENVYDGTVRLNGFTNYDRNTISDYIKISNENFKTLYLEDLWSGLIDELKKTLPEYLYPSSTEKKLLDDHDGFAVMTDKKDAGDYYVPASTFETAFKKVLDGLNETKHFRENYNDILFVRECRLEINKAPLLIKTEGAEKAYDGTPLTKENLTVTVRGEVVKPSGQNQYTLAEGDTVTIKATGSQTHPGTSQNIYEITWGSVKPENYTLSEDLGKLTVTSRPLIIEAQDAYKFFGAANDPAFAVKVYPGKYVQDVDHEGKPAVDQNGNPIYKVVVDASGNPVVDTDGNPVLVMERAGEEIPATLTRWQGDNYTLQLNDSERGYTENLSIKITRQAGDIPGTYVITPAWAEDAVKNFEASFVNGKLTIGIARVSKDGGATWTYHQWLENDSSNYPESAYTEGTDDPSEQGAFDKARELAALSTENVDVIVETLCSNDAFGTYGIADRFVLKKQVKLEEETLHELTLRTTDGVKTSVIYRGYDGGSLFTTKCAFTLENITLDGDKDTYSASTDGGLVYVQAGGSLTVNSGATLQNSATSGRGGAIYAAGGAAVYVNSGASVTGNSAANGNAIFADDNAAMTMTGGAITRNDNTVGGAVEIGGADASLTFSGGAQIYDNLTDGAQRNIYLNYDGDEIINANGLTASAEIGVYVEDDVAGATTATGALFKKRGGVLNRFGTYSNISNLSAFINDRNDLRGTARDKNGPMEIIWFQPITVQVRYIRSIVNEDVMPEPAASIYLLEPGKYIVVDEIQYVPSYYNSDLPYDPNATNPIDLQNTGFTVEAIAQDIYRFHDRWGVANADKLGFWRGYAEYEMSSANTSESLRSNPTEDPQLEPKSEYGKWSIRTINPETLKPAENEKLVLYYMPYVCKITDADGNLLRVDGKIQAFQTLEAAFAAYGNNSLVFTKEDGTTTAAPACIKMLVEDYDLRSTTQIAVPASKPVILTTAATGDLELPGPYDGTAATRCVIYRGACATSMFSVSAGASFGIENIILDGESKVVDADGGLVNVQEGGTLIVNNGATLRNSIAASGGAIYANAGSTVNMSGGEITGNTAANNGAGIFLAQGSLMNISGNPSFGGTGINAANGNYKDETLTGKTNGGDNYPRPRQDIYIAGYLGTTGDDPTPAASLNVSGAITSAPGSIWVWAEIPDTAASEDAKEYNHYKQLKQFATYTGTTPGEDTLKAFRNAVDDESTENSTGEYLIGTLEGELTGKFIYWTGNAGYRKVILRAVTDNGTYSAGGGKYTVYKGKDNTTSFAKDIDGNLLPKEMQPGASGVFWIGILPYGDYTIQGNGKTYTLTVGDDTTVNGVETAPGSRDGVTVK